MDSRAAGHSSIMDSVQKMAISRRGGVRTRGGRLPPISMRDISQVTIKKENKKVIAPNIPQRRRIVKQDVEMKTDSIESWRPRGNDRDTRGRGRGRQPKVLLQTEGSFLAEGPAAKTKKDPLACESFSYSRLLRTAAQEDCEIKYDTETVKALLESYEECEAYENDCDLKLPYCLPLKKKVVSKIKVESGTNSTKKEIIRIKKEIKSEKNESSSVEETKTIKTEMEAKSDSDDEDFIGRKVIKIKKEIISDSEDDDVDSSDTDEPKKKVSPKVEKIDSEAEIKSSTEYFQNVKGSGMMMLLQIPSHTSIPEAETSKGDAKGEKKRAEDEPEQISSLFDCLEEGFVGKLQIMKSGRMKMKLGSVEFELLDGSSSDSYWEAVSIQMRDDTGDLAVLGEIEKKLVLVPVLDMLLTKDKAPGCKI